jgi:hypothetical protein
MGLCVVVEIESCKSGTDILGLIVLITRYTGVGVKVVSAVSVLVVTETVVEPLFAASRALTLNFKSLSTSNISIRNCPLATPAVAAEYSRQSVQESQFWGHTILVLWWW